MNVSEEATMRFTALDVETANEDLASICQIGIAEYENNYLVREWKTLVDPEDEFSAFNCSIHGITESDIAGAPTFRAVNGTPLNWPHGLAVRLKRT